MELSERIRRVARLLARYDQDNPVTEDAYKCADEVAQLETELADFRARRDEKFQDYEDCKEQRDAKQKLLSTWVNKYAELEEERDALKEIILNCPECRRTIKGLYHKATRKEIEDANLPD